MPNTQTPNNKAAQEIRAIMAAKNLSITDMADHLGISRSAASRRINGKQAMDLNEISVIADWLGVACGRIINTDQHVYAA